MADLPASAPESEVHPSKDVLGEVQGLRCLRDAPLLHHDLLVHEVWVAVVHPCPQHRVAALEDGAEGTLRGGGKVAHGADAACDVLREANDLLCAAVSAVWGPELAQGTGQEEHLLKVPALVRIDALHKGPTCEGQRVVLVISLAIPQDGVAGQLNAPLRHSPVIGQQRAATVNEATEVATLLPRVHQVSFGIDVLALAVDKGNFQAGRELLQHSVGVRHLVTVEGLVHLH
mmetsp:Transcript_134616/g.375165  ORF Transcript_134616/g.375165 Transcript_134616/m.375165 type:complete len:231 (-) Transcript_134616:1617-2309(-)